MTESGKDKAACVGHHFCRSGGIAIILILTQEQKRGSQQVWQEQPGAIPLTPRQEFQRNHLGIRLQEILPQPRRQRHVFCLFWDGYESAHAPFPIEVSTFCSL